MWCQIVTFTALSLALVSLSISIYVMTSDVKPCGEILYQMLKENIDVAKMFKQEINRSVVIYSSPNWFIGHPFDVYRNLSVYKIDGVVGVFESKLNVLIGSYSQFQQLSRYYLQHRNDSFIYVD